MTKLRFVLAGPPEPRCDARPSKRSTARCEMPPGHDGYHTGRTRCGYWKSWLTAETSTGGVA